MTELYGTCGKNGGQVTPCPYGFDGHGRHQEKPYRITNTDDVFEAEYGGGGAAHTGNRRPPAYDLTQLTKGLGTDYHTLADNAQRWACCILNHA